MAVTAVTVTEFTRGLSDFLHQVQYRGQMLDIQSASRMLIVIIGADVAMAVPESEAGVADFSTSVLG